MRSGLTHPRHPADRSIIRTMKGEGDGPPAGLPRRNHARRRLEVRGHYGWSDIGKLFVALHRAVATTYRSSLGQGLARAPEAAPVTDQRRRIGHAPLRWDSGDRKICGRSAVRSRHRLPSGFIGGGRSDGCRRLKSRTFREKCVHLVEHPSVVQRGQFDCGRVPSWKTGESAGIFGE